MNAGRILAALAMMTVASTASAQVTQDVTIAVNAISQIAVTGGAQSLTISTATAGSNPTDASVTLSWAVTTNQTNQKITASIDAAMPANVTLRAQLEAPAGGTSFGPNPLSTSSVDLVGNISTLAESGLDLIYTLSATPAAGVVASTTRTVTYTITAGP
ncbi:MAG: hypothetical protein ACREOK_07855 [Gemmatimonadaceae bacterium]